MPIYAVPINIFVYADSESDAVFRIDTELSKVDCYSYDLDEAAVDLVEE